MTDRFRRASDRRKKSPWRGIVDVSLTDVSVLVPVRYLVKLLV